MRLSATLDVGSSKIICLITECGRNPGEVRLKSYAATPSRGFYAGEIVNFFHAVESLRRNVAEAEEKINVRVEGVFAHFAFKRVKTQSVYVRRIIDGRITTRDIEAIDAFARSQIKVDAMWCAIDMKTVSYFVDKVKMTQSPCDMEAQELSVLLHVTLIPEATVGALRRCFDQAHLELLGVMTSPYASIKTVLDAQDIQASHITHIDMGKSGTHGGIFVSGQPAFLFNVPKGGDSLTRALAEKYALPWGRAEAMKCAGHPLVEEVAQLVGESIFAAMKEGLKMSPYFEGDLNNKLIITGMSSYAAGLLSVAQKVFSRHSVFMHTHLHNIAGVDGFELDPCLFSGAVGTALTFASSEIYESKDTETTPNKKLYKAWRWIVDHF